MNLVQIIGLFEHEEITFDLRRNAQFLVGPNGTGKSTALRILYYLLTGQWTRLSKMPFTHIVVVFAEQPTIFERSDFLNLERLLAFFRRRFRRLRGKNTLPLSVKSYLSATEGPRQSTLRRLGSAMPNIPDNYVELARLQNWVEDKTREQVLYYPTYRRVERDLGELLELESEWEDDEGASLKPTIVDRFTQFGEVVGFGGQDIEKLFETAASSVENAARKALNEHSIRFLEFIVKERPKSTKNARLLISEQGQVERLFNRLERLAPDLVDFEKIAFAVFELREKLESVKGGRLDQAEEILISYVGDLIKLTNQIERLSSTIQKFVSITQKYFVAPKKLEYDALTNQVWVSVAHDERIDFDDLSSGEKQILSIFAFLLLSHDKRGQILIIDEPELSLSVGWQRALSKDILAAGRTGTLIAATHSPFIIENYPLGDLIELGDL